jgi:hypothetical protein
MGQALVFYLQLPITIIAALCYTAIIDGCNKTDEHMLTERNVFKKGHLAARPKHTLEDSEFKTGVQPLKLDARRDGFFYVPNSYHKDSQLHLQ